ncbi:hypothetical protein SLEP1_g36785 [Rubroshorea leprosula]|uniref:Uncharacterized protein n=1 Tax=Rubroshorea leprosula TaxID=152421 RepID=A0AAV5KT40_9ROSI|nr:hypothetical protein SLEP1_g36785 [Rubroshorea leprosula]
MNLHSHTLKVPVRDQAIGENSIQIGQLVEVENCSLPIDVTRGEAVKINHQGNLKTYYKPATAVLKNRGHYVMVQFRISTPNNHIPFNGSVVIIDVLISVLV